MPPGGTSVGAAGGSALPYRSIRDTELNGFFERHPQPGGGKWVEWPRVAITLTDAPAWGRDKQNVHQFKFPSAGCWTFRARIWESEEKSRDIAPLPYCAESPPLTKHGGDSEMVYQVWSGIVGRFQWVDLDERQELVGDPAHRGSTVARYTTARRDAGRTGLREPGHVQRHDPLHGDV